MPSGANRTSTSPQRSLHIDSAATRRPSESDPQMPTYGDCDCAGAIFIFKDDGTEFDALTEAAAVARQHRLEDTFTQEEKARVMRVLGYDPTDASGRFVYVVHTTDREEFMARLSEWHERTKHEDAALLIYAHMGENDLGPDEGDSPGVAWRELGKILSDGVSSLWLAGCESDHCLTHWATSPSMHPVKNWLVSTSASVYWLPLIPYFVKELSVAPVCMPNEIAQALSLAFPGQARLRQREDQWLEVPG